MRFQPLTPDDILPEGNEEAGRIVERINGLLLQRRSKKPFCDIDALLFRDDHPKHLREAMQMFIAAGWAVRRMPNAYRFARQPNKKERCGEE